MRILIRVGLASFCTVFIALLLFSTSVSAQGGMWAPYDLSNLDGSGTGVVQHGDGCMFYAKSSSRHLLVFDIEANGWLQVDLGTTHSFSAGQVLSDGNVVMAFTDDLLFG